MSLDIQIKERNNIKLTLTPNRLTLKFPIGINESEKIEVINLANKVKELMNPLTKAWRGKFHKINDNMNITMFSNGNHQKQTFKL